MQPERRDSVDDTDGLKPLVVSLLAKIDELLSQNKALLVRIAELEAHSGRPPKTPTNSSLPPSGSQNVNRRAKVTRVLLPTKTSIAC